MDKLWIFLSIILIGILGLAPLTSGEDTIEVLATGVADGKTAQARDEALNDALRKAVEQGVGTVVIADLTVEQQRLVEDRIYTEREDISNGIKFSERKHRMVSMKYRFRPWLE